MDYLPRVLDSVIAQALTEHPAIALDGAKSVGKSATATRFARSSMYLDRPEELAVLRADRSRIDRVDTPLLVDEWQLDPPVWDAVRRSVDADGSPGRFILTDSANPQSTSIHTGAGRIVRFRMRPMALVERQTLEPTVSLRQLSHGEGTVDGESNLGLDGYVDEILASGFPGLRSLSSHTRDERLDSYLSYAISREVAALGTVIRRPAMLEAWLRAYAAASSTSASFDSIATAVAKESRPSRATIADYREALTQLWLLDEVPAWVPFGRELNRLGQAPKHQLADPALAARLLRASRETLLSGRTIADRADGYRHLRRGPLLGSLFESLATLSVRVYAEAFGARVSHLRTHGGDHEIDLIVEAPDGRVLAMEVKLATDVDAQDVRHLNWLAEQLGDDVVARVILTTGRYAYRRPDGVHVVPLVLLGP